MPAEPIQRRGFEGRSLDGLRYVYLPAAGGPYGAIQLEFDRGGGRCDRAALRTGELPKLADDDRALIARLYGAPDGRSLVGALAYLSGLDRFTALPEPLPLAGSSADALLRDLAATRRLFLAPALCRNAAERAAPLDYDADEPFRYRLVVDRDDAAAAYRVRAEFRRGDETLDLAALSHRDEKGRLVADGRILRCADAAPLMKGFRAATTPEGLAFPFADADRLLTRLLELPGPPEIATPEDLRLEDVRTPPVPVFVVTDPGVPRGVKDPDSVLLGGDASFLYGAAKAPFRDASRPLYDVAARRRYLRDPAEEERRRAEIGALPVAAVFGAGAYEFRRSELVRVVVALAAAGWRVEAKGVRYRAAGKVRLRVAASGVDWFDLSGAVDFDGVDAALPALLEAVEKGATTVTLADGSTGVLTDELLKRLRRLRLVGDPREDGVRFGASQSALLDALLAAEPDVQRDASFERLVADARRLADPAEADPPPEFRGELRPYQRRGLGWLRALDELGYGGCLADDMGLGKTVQALAFLAGRKPQRPSLVVAPRSLLFNWRQEAAQFAPGLRVVDHAAPDRASDAAAFLRAAPAGALVLTTYGILRRDAAWMKDVRFDVVLLDEAQAVKNADADAAKAVRLLKADRRLALSGTPVENRLGELWSLCEFLNPGMLGAARRFDAATKDAPPATLALLGRAVRPFLLRRTKEEAAPELPERIEQTVLCELDGPQRELYEELRAHYRGVFGGATEGFVAPADDAETPPPPSSTLSALTALLRLRQTACHPGLCDPERADHASAKLDVLVDRLREIAAAGHRALVFSQFTSFLDLVGRRLDAEKIGHARLDGATQDRARVVKKFRDDPTRTAFLLSLKAGGVGLNLTEASYVFLLDPWWNPAAEAQAIDRAHRIGQTRGVTAYRLVAAGTVEERVLELQAKKRALAEAVVGPGAATGPALTAEDLRRLFA